MTSAQKAKALADSGLKRIRVNGKWVWVSTPKYAIGTVVIHVKYTKARCEIVGFDTKTNRYSLKRPGCTTKVNEQTLDREYEVAS